jgi:hypothetical protein
MPYIGNTPTTQSFSSGTDYFNGNASQVAFTLSRAVASINDVQVVVNNVAQAPNSGYTISGNTLTFDAAPSIGTNNVYVRYLSTTTQVITPNQNTVSYASLNTDMQQDIGASFKNRIINGDMRIDQRNAGASIANATVFNWPVDRFRMTSITNNTATLQRVEDAPANTSFMYSTRITCTTGQTLTSVSYHNFGQPIEGSNVADFKFGTAAARTITVSFWVKSSLTGTFGGSINSFDSSPVRSYVFQYAISTANTWEYKTVTIPGDVAGTWPKTTSAGLYLLFVLGEGSQNATATPNTWLDSDRRFVTGNVMPMTVTGSTWQITGVQVELGSTATAFDYRSIGTELALCQRYCYVQRGESGERLGFGYCGTTTLYNLVVPLPATMRATPTLISCSPGQVNDNQAAYNSSSITIGDSITNTCVNLKVNTSGMTVGRGAQFYFSPSAGSMILSAEL